MRNLINCKVYPGQGAVKFGPIKTPAITHTALHIDANSRLRVSNLCAMKSHFDVSEWQSICAGLPKCTNCQRFGHTKRNCCYHTPFLSPPAGLGSVREVIYTVFFIFMWTTFPPLPSTYTNDTTLVATSKLPALLVKYLVNYLADLEIWLRDWRIAIIVGKTAAVLLRTRRNKPPRPLRVPDKEMQCAENVKYVGEIDIPGLAI